MMSSFRMAAILAVWLIIGPGQVHAGMIIVSGDSSIVEGLTNTGGSVPLTLGNQTFFQNVLGGGSTVRVLDTTTGDDLIGNGVHINVNTVLNNFYNGLAGVTSSLIDAPITASSLAGVNLLVIDLPDAALTTTELAALNGFLAGGGRVFFLGEAITNQPVSDPLINTDLTALGSSLQLTSQTLDSGLHLATVANGQILNDPLSSGISSFGYAQVTGVTGGSGVFLTSDQKTVLVAEQATPNAVPEPSTLVNIATTGLIGLCYTGLRRRRAV